ncbi:MAG TPA: DUF4238 domain-containing protein, partial [Anaerolineales bacterium]|nr:DUF4238 domain-containing protein [Anaerolineales bacterium]
MPLHHYVPLSVISEFASAESWKVVRASRKEKARIARLDAEAIKRVDKRKWPICIYEKDKHRLTRKPAEKVCSQIGLYRVPNYNYRENRALIRRSLENSLFDGKPLFENFDEFLRLGDIPVDLDMIERVQIGEIDGKFAGLLPLLRNGQQLNDEQISIILRFVAFARFRTPTWRRVYFSKAYGEPVARLKQSLEAQRPVALMFDVQRWASLGELISLIDDLVYNMAIVLSCDQHLNVLRNAGARILILHTEGSAPFITCDNPARPYHTDRIRRMLSEPLPPGFQDGKSQIVYPISPKSCLLISSNP